MSPGKGCCKSILASRNIPPGSHLSAGIQKGAYAWNRPRSAQHVDKTGQVKVSELETRLIQQGRVEEKD